MQDLVSQEKLANSVQTIVNLAARLTTSIG